MWWTAVVEVESFRPLFQLGSHIRDIFLHFLEEEIHILNKY